MGNIHTALCEHQLQWLSWGKALELQAELALCFREHYFCSKEWLVDDQTMIIHTWVSAKHFLKNEQSDVFVANNKMWASKWKLEFWKTCICHG